MEEMDDAGAGPLEKGPHQAAVNHEGPWIQAAAFCEVMIDGKDDVISLIRIVDRFFVPKPPHADVVMGEAAGDEAGPPPPNVVINLVLMLKAGNARGTVGMRLVIEGPDGIRRELGRANVLMEGEDRGGNVVMPLAMHVRAAGLYWFDVFADDVLMTRMPLRVVWQN